MPSPLDTAKMIPASGDDPINPGCLYFACLNPQRKTDPESYWIVMRAPREWLPEGFFDTRPLQQRVFPFWIVEKDQRVWLARTSLYYLDRSQREIFTLRSTKLEFTNMLILIDSFQNAEAALMHFKRRIIDSTKEYSVGRERRERVNKSIARSRSTRSSSPVMDELFENPAQVLTSNTEIRPPDPLPVPVVVRAEGVNTPSNTITDAQSQLQLLLQSPQTAIARARALSPQFQSSNRTRTFIKTESEERRIAAEGETSHNRRVTIYVGTTNVVCTVLASALQQKCPFLHSLININRDTGEKFIMHPRLNAIHPDDFQSILQFIERNEYEPVAVRAQNGHQQYIALAGQETVAQYSETLVKAARLYVLAKHFQVQGMANLIEHKVCDTAWTSYDNRAIIDFAFILFTRPLEFFAPVPDSGPVDPNGMHFYRIDHWAVTSLAANFIKIMQNNVEQRRYLEFMEATRERRVHTYVLAQAAQDYARDGGAPTVVID